MLINLLFIIVALLIWIFLYLIDFKGLLIFYTFLLIFLVIIKQLLNSINDNYNNREEE